MMTLKDKLEVLQSMGKRVVFNFDMDGCLAQWEVGCTYEKTWEPHYFLYRDLEVVLRDAVCLLLEAGYECQATSAAYEEGTARQDKSDWLDNNGMKDLKRIFMPCGKNKADFIDIEDGVTYVLLDDYSFNLLNWEATDKPRSNFVAVKFLNGINGETGKWNGRTVHYHSSAEIIAHTLVDFAIMA